MSIPGGSMSSESGIASNISISGPSGSGKSTLINHILKKYGKWCELIVSHTTRSSRDGEKDGFHYHFVDIEEMNRLIKAQEMFLVVEFDGRMYGTRKSSVNKVKNAGKICIFDVSAESALKLRGIIEGPSVLIFIKPPSIEVLKQRLLARGNSGNIERRIESAHKEMEYENRFDRVIKNEILERAFEEIEEVVSAEVRKISGGNMA